MRIKAARSNGSATSPFGKTEKTTFHKWGNFVCSCPANSYALPHNIYSLLATVKLVKTLNWTLKKKKKKTAHSNKKVKNYVFGAIFRLFSLARQSSGRASKLAFLSAMPLWKQTDYFTEKKNGAVHFLANKNWLKLKIGSIASIFMTKFQISQLSNQNSFHQISELIGQPNTYKYSALQLYLYLSAYLFLCLPSNH